MKPTTEMMYAALQAAGKKEGVKFTFQDIHDIVSAALAAEPGLVIEDTHTCQDGQCRLGKRLSVG